jgi:arginine utilization protein RocB
MVKDEIKTELSSGKWMVGRGSADMKSGIAISLYMLLYFDLPDELNLLFTAVSDEENLSAGAIQAVDLYKELKEIFGLDYKLAIVTEPDSYKKVDGPFNVMHGSSGKMLPVVVAKGCLCHSANILNGLNPTLIISEVIRRLELSADFQSPSYGVAPQPPTTLFIFDSKKTYDVSIPEYCAAGFNVMSLYPADPAEYIDKLLAVCEEAAASAIEKYSATYDSVERTGVLAGPKMDFKPEVLTVENLREKLKEKYADFDSRLELIEKNVMLEFEKKNFPMHKAGILYIESLIELAQTAQPIIVLGFVPPYYPSISNYFLSKETLEMIDGIISELNDEGVVKAKNGAFIPGPTDLSYFACLNLHANQKILASLCVPKAAYNIDFESLSRLQIPSIQIGAAGLNVHEACERVYLPDLDEKVPYIIGKILRSF